MMGMPNAQMSFDEAMSGVMGTDADVTIADIERAQREREAATVAATTEAIQDLAGRIKEAVEYARDYKGNFAFMVAMRQAVAEGRPFSAKMAESVLKCKVKDLEWATNRAERQAMREAQGAPAVPTTIEDGFYELPVEGSDEIRIVKVKTAIHTSGRQYGTYLDTATGSWEYERGLVYKVRESGKKLTLERAKELGHLYGRCMVCGATLTNERSIERGIGPICAGNL